MWYILSERASEASVSMWIFHMHGRTCSRHEEIGNCILAYLCLPKTEFRLTAVSAATSTLACCNLGGDSDWLRLLWWLIGDCGNGIIWCYTSHSTGHTVANVADVWRLQVPGRWLRMELTRPPAGADPEFGRGGGGGGGGGSDKYMHNWGRVQEGACPLSWQQGAPLVQPLFLLLRLFIMKCTVISRITRLHG